MPWLLNNLPLADYGITSASLTLGNQVPDELVLGLDGSADAGADFTPGSAWDLHLDDTRIFAGTVRVPGRALTGEAEGRRIVIEGPWARLERIIYQQRHQAYSPAGAELVGTYRYHSRVLLGQAEDESKIVLGQELKRILAYAYGRVLAADAPANDATLYTVPAGAGLALGTIPDGPTPPGLDFADVSCAEAIRALLRFLPDAVVRFDYATTPPTVSVVRRATATVRSLPAYAPALPATPPAPDPVALDITPREDLLVPLVVLKYARGVDAGTYRNPAFWIDYAGLIGGVESAAAGWVDDITDPSPGVPAAMVQTIQLGDDAYTAIGGTGALEDVPTGLALALREALRDVQYEGRHTTVAAECAPLIRPGDLLNLTGGRTEWATMRAQIQTVRHDLDAGSTELIFGPAAHLGAGDWLELMRANRIPLPGVPKNRPGQKPARATTGTGALLLTLTRPEGYTEAEGAGKGWLTWGHVNSVVIANIATSYALATGLKIYLKATTNGAIPLLVTAAEIDATTSTRTDTGGTASTPATTAYYLLGQVGGAGTTESPFFLVNAGEGNLHLGVSAVGYTCVAASAGDPGATPPVEASPGGVRTDYQLRWTRG